MTPTESQSLDLDRLEKVRHLSGKVTFRCPGCAADVHDKAGEHGVLFLDTGKWSCIVDETHKKAISNAAGIRQPLDPVEEARRREEWIRRKHEEREQERKRQAAQKALPNLIKEWQWDPADVAKDSPMDPEEGDCPRGFLLTMFRPQALVWTGQVHDSGERHADRWKTVWQCLHEPAENIGPMVTPSTWKPGTVSRKRENVATAPYVVLDFDGPKQWKPRDQADLDRHIAESLAIVRWLKEDRQWNLAAIVYTGNKSLHAWFDHPGESLLSSLRESLPILGIDKSLIGHPEHPARLPGKVHDKSGKMSRVLWLRYNGKR